MATVCDKCKELEERVKALETLVEQVSEGIEKAKEHPLVGTMLKTLGM